MVALMISRSISTEELAAGCMVRPASIRVKLCREGHYFGLVPDKLPNGRLAWPADWREKMVPSARKARG
jgi:hypothetical protein